MIGSEIGDLSVAAGVEAAPAARSLEFDPALLRSGLNRKPFVIEHRLADHPLFALPALVELSRALPVEDVEYNAGNLPIEMDPARTPKTGLSIEETIRRIEECGSWLVMKYVERVPEYRELLDCCLNEVEAALAPERIGMRQREAFIFVSSPASVTPYHFDPEYNFLLQIRGAKTVRVFPRALVSEEELEERFSYQHRNLQYQESYRQFASAFTLMPGSALHIPIAAPHWVKNGDGVSISFSVTFRSAASEREAALYRFNAKLRARGIRPAPVHRSPLRDRLKFAAYHGLRLGAKPIKALTAFRRDADDPPPISRY